jgi:HAD superfamily hydrolase (TIGR01509 family)
MPGSRPAIKAILLDLFDTTIYCPWGKLRREMARTAGIPVEDFLFGYTRTQAARNTGVYGSERRDLQEISRAGGLQLTDRQISSLMDFERAYLSRHGEYYPDVELFLESTKRNGIATGVISNCSRGAATLIDRLKTRKLVNHVLLSFEAGHRKPTPEIYLQSLRALDVDPGHALFIDDQLKFCAGAAAVGMFALPIQRSITDHKGAPYNCPHVSALDISLLSETDLFMPPAG